MSDLPFKFSWQDLELWVYEGILFDIGGGSPIPGWNLHGVTGHNANQPEQIEAYNKEKDKVEAFLNTKEGIATLHKFLSESFGVMNALQKNPEGTLESLFDRKNFLFIVGTMRTGGTYLYTQMLKLLGENHLDYNIGLTHDGIPSYDLILNRMFPHSYPSLLFQMAQWLTWANKKQGQMPHIVQKRVGYAHILDFLDQIFGVRGNYIVTLRHPLTSFLSLTKMSNIDYTDPNIAPPDLWHQMVNQYIQLTKEEWQSLPHTEQYLLHWEAYHKDIARNKPLIGPLRALTYGKDFENFINLLGQSWGSNHKAEPFNALPKEIPDDLKPFLERAEQAIEHVKLYWQVHGLEFPNLEVM